MTVVMRCFSRLFHFMSDAFYRPIIRLCTAGGEINIHRTGMNQRSDLFPRILHRFMGIAADSVKGGCISVILCKRYGTIASNAICEILVVAALSAYINSFIFCAAPVIKDPLIFLSQKSNSGALCAYNDSDTSPASGRTAVRVRSERSHFRTVLDQRIHYAAADHAVGLRHFSGHIDKHCLIFPVPMISTASRMTAPSPAAAADTSHHLASGPRPSFAPGLSA